MPASSERSPPSCASSRWACSRRPRASSLAAAKRSAGDQLTPTHQMPSSALSDRLPVLPERPHSLSRLFQKSVLASSASAVREQPRWREAVSARPAQAGAPNRSSGPLPRSIGAPRFPNALFHDKIVLAAASGSSSVFGSDAPLTGETSSVPSLHGGRATCKRSATSARRHREPPALAARYGPAAHRTALRRSATGPSSSTTLQRSPHFNPPWPFVSSVSPW